MNMDPLANLGGMMPRNPTIEELLAMLQDPSKRFSMMTPGALESGQIPNMAVPPLPTGPQMPTSGPPGAPSKISQLMQNPQLLQTIAMGLMAALGGKNKGYMMQGMQQTMQQQAEVQRQLQESQRQEQLRRDQLGIQQQGVDVDKYRALTERGRWQLEGEQAEVAAGERSKAAAELTADKYRGRVSDITKDFIQPEVDKLPPQANAAEEHAAKVQIGYAAARIMGLDESNPKDAQRVQDLVKVAVRTNRKTTVEKPTGYTETEFVNPKAGKTPRLGSFDKTTGQYRDAMGNIVPDPQKPPFAPSSGSTDIVAQMKKRYADLKKIEALGKATPDMIAEMKGIEDSLQITRVTPPKGEPPEEYWLERGRMAEQADASTNMRPFSLDKAFEYARQFKAEYSKNKGKEPPKEEKQPAPEPKSTRLTAQEKQAVADAAVNLPDAQFEQQLQASVTTGECTAEEAREIRNRRSATKAWLSSPRGRSIAIDKAASVPVGTTQPIKK